MMKLLFLSTPVGPLGSGLGGGVELTLFNVAQAINQRGHTVTIVAPNGSKIEGLPVVQIEGELQKPVQNQNRSDPISMVGNAVLVNMWDYARQVQLDYDLIFNLAYDWLPFYLTPFFQRPVIHQVSMGSLSTAIDQVIEQVATAFPNRIGVCSEAQAETFPFALRGPVLGGGLDLAHYPFRAAPEGHLGWMGRLAPEKGLEDAMEAAARAGTPLKIWGAQVDATYWQSIRQRYPDAAASYEGFLPTDPLARALGSCRALIVTPKWVEAFGNVVIEALACGVPVISYRRGGPSEIIQEGKTGWLVEPDSVEGLVQAIERIDQLDRQACRQQAEVDYSLESLGQRFEAWFQSVIQGHPP